MICPSCGEREATCDDDCPECCADLYITGAEPYDAEELTWRGDKLWSLPGYRDAQKLILAARETA